MFPSPEKVASFIEQDLNCLICCTCGAQFSLGTLETEICAICADDRQWVPAAGQLWTTLRQLQQENRTIEFIPDEHDPDILTWIVTKPPFAIQQSPLLVRTASGWVMVECCAFINQEAIEHIQSTVKKSGLPFLGIALSHPHWYNSGTTWARALGTKIHASALDREWWMRKESEEECVEWFTTHVQKLGEQTTMIRCGGHFPGSCITHVKREKKKPIALVADTIMIGWSSVRRQVSFMYSYPNFIPLDPESIIAIWDAIKGYEFDDAYGAWPIRKLVGGAKEEIYDQIGLFLRRQGYVAVQLGLKP